MPNSWYLNQITSIVERFLFFLSVLLHSECRRFCVGHSRRCVFVIKYLFIVRALAGVCLFIKYLFIVRFCPVYSAATFAGNSADALRFYSAIVFVVVVFAVIIVLFFVLYQLHTEYTVRHVNRKKKHTNLG